MTGYKEYRSVSQFPLHTEKLSREELETAYQDLRSTYKNLGISRGQLVRRQTEAKNNLVTINQKLTQLTDTLKKVQLEKQQLQEALAHSVHLRQKLENWGNELTVQVDDLTAQMHATTKLLEEFESVYEEVQENNGILSIWSRLQRLLTAANRLLNADIKSLMPQKRIEPQPETWTQETPDQINRSLLDE